MYSYEDRIRAVTLCIKLGVISLSVQITRLDARVNPRFVFSEVRWSALLAVFSKCGLKTSCQL